MWQLTVWRSGHPSPAGSRATLSTHAAATLRGLQVLHLYKLTEAILTSEHVERGVVEHVED